MGTYRTGDRRSHAVWQLGGGRRQAASQHIEQARRLSAELGGTDSDVKVFFFGLTGGTLKSVLDEYESKYGKGKRQYAEKVLPLWRNGQRQMSGLVAERLFSLLPPRMAIETKYDLVRRLWEKCGPSTRGRVIISPDSDPGTASSQIERQLLKNVTEYRIPDRLEKRFAWLAAGDVELAQQLLNHFLAEERGLILADAKTRTDIVLHHLRNHGGWTDRIRQDYRIGKHTLEIVFEVRPTTPADTIPTHADTTPIHPVPQTSRRYPVALMFVAAFCVGILLGRILIR